MANKAVVARALTGCAFGATGLLTLAGPVSAQTDQSCQTASFADFQMLYPSQPLTPVVPISLDAGVVSITEAHSWDGYPARVGIDQASEVWHVEFIGADGSIVGTSAPTPDLDDLVEETHWYGSLGDVTLSAPAVAVQARHLVTGADQSMNSVHVSDITVCVDVVAPTTTAAPTTTEAPTTTTVPTTATPTTAPPPSGPTVPEPTSTTTAPDPKGPTTSEPAPKGPSLPVTGSESSLMLLGGMWLLAAGSTLVAFGRTR